MTFVCYLRQTTVKDFAARSIGILQESMHWAPNTTRSHLVEYLLTMDNASRGLYQHSGLALATESVLNYAGYNRGSGSLGVRDCGPSMLFFLRVDFMLFFSILVVGACIASMKRFYCDHFYMSTKNISKFGNFRY